MGEIVNLRRLKKRREQEAHAAEAKQNRVRHGRTGAAKTNDKRAEEKRLALLAAVRRDKP